MHKQKQEVMQLILQAAQQEIQRRNRRSDEYPEEYKHFKRQNLQFRKWAIKAKEQAKQVLENNNGVITEDANLEYITWRDQDDDVYQTELPG